MVMMMESLGRLITREEEAEEGGGDSHDDEDGEDGEDGEDEDNDDDDHGPLYIQPSTTLTALPLIILRLFPLSTIWIVPPFCWPLSFFFLPFFQAIFHVLNRYTPLQPSSFHHPSIF